MRTLTMNTTPQPGMQWLNTLQQKAIQPLRQNAPGAVRPQFGRNPYDLERQPEQDMFVFKIPHGKHDDQYLVMPDTRTTWKDSYLEWYV